MRIAYIITAYQDPAHLKRLIRALDAQADYFIHVDSRVDMDAFRAGLESGRNVEFCQTRFFVNWGSFAQVLSQKELLRCVMESGRSYDRVVCLSGSDYPIWSNSRIRDEYRLRPDAQFIMGYNVTRCAEPGHHERVAFHHFLRDVRVGSRRMKRWMSGSSRLLLRGLSTLLGIRRREQVQLEGRWVDIYTGSDYWALTFECARHVYDRMCAETAMMKYFKYSYVPSEMCVQTIVFNSRFAGAAILVEGKYRGLATLTPLHHLAYTDAIKVFDEAGLEELQGSGKMFFRKAQTGKSDTLLALIDRSRAADS